MATVIPTDYAFGAGGGAITNITLQSRSVSTRMEKKTATGSDGETIAVAFHGKTAEHKIELLDVAAINSLACVATATKPSVINKALDTDTSYYIVEDVTVDIVNDDFTKGSVTISEYAISNF